MILTCPQCSTQYQIDAAAFGEGRRKLRCNKCAFVWDGDGGEAGNAKAGARQGAAQNDDINAQAMRLLAASRRARRRLAEQDRLRRKNRNGWIALAASLAVFFASAYFLRTGIVRQFPNAAGLYAALNLPVNIRGLELRNITTMRDYENGLPVLSVRGEVVNVTGEPLHVPRVRFGLRDQSRQEIYSWSVSISGQPLAPQQSVKFVTRLASPPSEAGEIMVRFVKNDDAPKRIARK